MGTHVVYMDDWGSTHFFCETIFDEAAGLMLGCWYSLLPLHYYSNDISDIHSQTVLRLNLWTDTFDRRVPSFMYYNIVIYIKRMSRTLYEQKQIITFWCYRLIYLFYLWPIPSALIYNSLPTAAEHVDQQHLCPLLFVAISHWPTDGI